MPKTTAQVVSFGNGDSIGTSYCYIRQVYFDFGFVKNNKSIAWLYNWFAPKEDEEFAIHMIVENATGKGQLTPAQTKMASFSLGDWSREQSTGTRLYISKIPGMKYDFKKLVFHNENLDFKALPAKKGGKEGIAVHIDGKFKAFLEL